jgi:hypothetical protein
MAGSLWQRSGPSTDSSAAASETVAASGSSVYMRDQSEESDARTVPLPGVMSTIPQMAAGEQTEPSASAPLRQRNKPAATAVTSFAAIGTRARSERSVSAAASPIVSS